LFEKRDNENHPEWFQVFLVKEAIWPLLSAAINASVLLYSTNVTSEGLATQCPRDEQQGLLQDVRTTLVI